MLPSDQLPKVTVDDLLRLKRAERPAPEFWVNFERELRQKQLTALLEKRPWWREFPQFLARRAYLPVGATAVLAFTLVSVKYYVPTQHEFEPPADASIASSRQADSISPVRGSAPVSSPLVNRSEVVAVTEPAVVAVSTPPVETPAAPLSAGAIETSTVAVTLPVETPSSRYIATNLDRLEKTDPELIRAVMGNRLSSPVRVQEASVPLAELATVPISSGKRNRLFAQYTERLLSPEPTAPDLVRERLARRLGDSEISDRISRIGLKGDQVSLGLTLRL